MMPPPVIPDTLRICACGKELAVNGRAHCLVCILAGWVPIETAEMLAGGLPVPVQPMCPCGCGLPLAVVEMISQPPNFWERLPLAMPVPMVPAARYRSMLRGLIWLCLGMFLAGLSLGRWG
jgi:hypothetical protein